ncbi:MAG: Lin1244/Lin1753 domain-containing protein [Bacteroidota bacterium]
MRWFKHDCMARNDPRMMEVVQRHGGEGLALYWTVLEETGRLSHTLHLKITGLSEETDRNFRDLQEGSEVDRCFGKHLNCIDQIPEFGAKLLAGCIRAKAETLEKVLTTCVEFNLFDRAKWVEYNVLYSSDFASLADPYHRGSVKRPRQNSSVKSTHSEDVDTSPDIVRTTPDTLQTTDQSLQRTEQSLRTTDQTLHTTSQKLFPRTETETETRTETEGEKKKNRTEAEDARALELSTTHPQKSDPGGYRSLGIEIDRIAEYETNCRIIVQAWNQSHGSSFEWEISDLDLEKLFLDGDRALKERLCYESLHLTGGRRNYPLLVYRAVRLMLITSEKSRITNQFGWLWACLNGRNGSPPWVQQITSEEKRSIPSLNRGPLVGPGGLVSGGDN